MTDPLASSSRTTVFRGALLSVGMRWGDRLLGVASTVVLARLLTPADFGLVAMATVVVGLLDVLLDLGVGNALIQNPRAVREDFDTAWTVRLLQATGTALLLLASAPLAAAYYNDPRVEAILRVVAVAAFIGGLENIGTVSFQRNMEFGRDVQFLLVKRLFAVLCTVGLALWLRSYWALVLGTVASRLAGVGLSYWLSPFRPRLSMVRFAGIWSFSQWNLFMGVGRYLGMSLGRFVIGRRQDAGILGTYTMGEEIAAMPSTELLAPLGRVMFPVFAAARDEPAALSRLVGLAQGVQALIVLPACVGIILVAGDAVALLLGPQWAPAVPFVQIIALGNAVMLPGHATGYMLLALGHVRAQSICMWIKLAVLALLVLVLFPGAGALGVANARLAVSVVDVVVVQLVARAIVTGFRPLGFLAQAWRPLVASGAMAGAVLAVAAALAGATATTRLLAEVASGGAAYVLCALLLWRTAGFPAGAETYLLGKLGLRRAGP